MGMVGNDPNVLQSEINVTPLVDVVLVLLIIFMVVIPMTLRGYDVDIPSEARSVTEEVLTSPAEQVVLSIEARDCDVLTPPPTPGLPENCRVRLNDLTIPVTELPARVAETFDGRVGADRVLFLAAQEQLNYEGVMRIVDLAKSGAADLRIGVVTG